MHKILLKDQQVHFDLFLTSNISYSWLFYYVTMNLIKNCVIFNCGLIWQILFYLHFCSHHHEDGRMSGRNMSMITV
jgi:hypothetical protein